MYFLSFDVDVEFVGIQNPYGRNISRVKGRDAYVNMWSALVKSAPDFFFDILETRAFYDPSTYHMIVASKFSWFGTRVMDVKFSTKPQVAGDAQANSSENKEENKSNDATESKADTVDEYIFSSEKSNEFDTENVNEAKAESETTGKFYVDTTPLKQKLQMSCKGTFLVYIYTNYLQEALKKQQQAGKKTPTRNHVASTPTAPASSSASGAPIATTIAGNTVDTSLPSNINLPLDPSYINKVFKLEFIYTASDEKLIQESSTDAVGNTSASSSI